MHDSRARAVHIAMNLSAHRAEWQRWDRINAPTLSSLSFYVADWPSIRSESDDRFEDSLSHEFNAQHFLLDPENRSS